VNITDENGRGVMVMSGGDPLITQFWIRTHLKQGAFFQDPTLGHRFHMVKKATADGARLLRDLALEALRPLLDMGWLLSIDCRAEVNEAPGRIDLHLQGMKNDGFSPVSFDTFYEVV
jgi:phage gp46-like protein